MDMQQYFDELHKKLNAMSDNELEKLFEDVPEEELYNADPNCKHEIVSDSSGIRCKKCGGWFCY